MSVFVRNFTAFGVMGACAASDISTRRIPNRIILPALLAALAIDIVSSAAAEPMTLFLMFLFIFVLLAAFALGRIGGGDVKLYIFLCLIYPDERALVAIVASVVLAALLIIFLCITRQKDALRAPLPLGALTAGGTLIAAFSGRGA